MAATLSTLTEWVKDFTHMLFEVRSSNSEWLAYFNRKVSPDAIFTVKGAIFTTPEIREQWAKHRESYVWEKVDWQGIAELPSDAENPTQAGIVTGFYVATGVYKKPKNPALPAFIKKRTPHIYIEPRDPDSDEDTRQLVRLTVVSIEGDIADPHE